MPRAWYSKEKTQEAAKRLAVFFGVLLILWILSTISWFAPIFHTIQGAAYWASSGVSQAISRIFANEESITNRLRVCEEERSEQALRATTLAAAANEVAQWRALFAYVQQGGTGGVAAQVIARGDLASSDILLDQGAGTGIQEGSAVVVGEGQLFGVITRVSATQSLVQLIEDPKSTIPAQILGQEKTIGIVEGNEGAALSMEYIPQDAAIRVGDSVVTSGLGGRVPAGLLIGTVTEISTEPNAPFMSATISPLHDARASTVVMVMPYAHPAL